MEGEPAQGSGGPEQELPALSDEPPPEVSEAQRRVKRKKIPPTVSKDEYDNHMITHLPFRSWCDHCVRGKTREDDHPTRPSEPLEVAKLSLDYCFFGRVLTGWPSSPRLLSFVVARRW